MVAKKSAKPKVDFPGRLEQVKSLFPHRTNLLLWFGTGQVRSVDRDEEGWKIGAKSANNIEPRFHGLVIRIGKELPLICVESTGTTGQRMKPILVAEAALGLYDAMVDELTEGIDVGVDIHTAKIKGTLLADVLAAIRPALRVLPPALFHGVGCGELLAESIKPTPTWKTWYAAPWPRACFPDGETALGESPDPSGLAASATAIEK